MYYSGLFDINGDGMLDGFEEFMEYKAFEDFSEDYEDEFDIDDEYDEDLY